MITYQKKWMGLYMLGSFSMGSPSLGALIPATFSAAFAAALSALGVVNPAEPGDRTIMEHPYPYQIFCFVLGFVLVFRTTWSYNRYSQAVQSVALMTSKWGDVALQTVGFDTLLPTCGEGGEAPGGEEGRTAFRVAFIHLLSLLHAVALLHLRADDDVRNLTPYAAPSDGTTPQSGDNSGSYSSNGGDSTNRGFQAPFLSERLWQVVGSAPPLIAADHGWATAASSEAVARAYHAANPLGVMDGVCAAEAKALGCVHDKTFLVMQWVVDVLVLQGKLKWLEVEGPIVSRLYQELSDGMLGFNQARKLTEVPFPFPYAELVTALLAVYAVSVPVLMTAWVEGPGSASILTFIAVWAYFAINETNRNLEDPFLHGPHDLPLPTLQADFNNRLASLAPSDRANRLFAHAPNLQTIADKALHRAKKTGAPSNKK